MKQVFHCEKEELVASSPRAAQGAFLSPLLGWKMATDVRYCEILKMLTLKGLWKASIVLARSGVKGQGPRQSLFAVCIEFCPSVEEIHLT